jgi:hypothetical protein
MERVGGIDERTDFAALGSGGECGKQDARTSGRIGSGNFGKAAAGQASGERVEGHDAGGDGVRCGSDFKMRSGGDVGEARRLGEMIEDGGGSVWKKMGGRESRRRSHEKPHSKERIERRGNPVDVRFLFACGILLRARRVVKRESRGLAGHVFSEVSRGAVWT